MRIFGIFFLFSLFWSCLPPDSEEVEIVVDFSNEEHRAILDLQDRRDTKKLLVYLKSEDTHLRYLAVRAFASIQDSTVIIDLADVLNNDPSGHVRTQAAYAIGQTNSGIAEKVLVDSFQSQDTSNVNTQVRSAILEAVGKCGTLASLNHLASVSSYRPEDHLLLLGQARALYRFGLRNIVSQSGTNKMIQLLLDTRVPEKVRLMAAQYIGRIRGIDLSSYKNQLSQLFMSDPNEKIRMALATGLGRTGDPGLLSVLIEQLFSDGDYRVKCNVVRSLRNFDTHLYRDTLATLLETKDPHVGEVVSDLFIENSQTSDVLWLLQKARSNYSPYITANLYAAALKVAPSGFVNTRFIVRRELSELIAGTTSVYDRSHFISALATDPGNYSTLLSLCNNREDNVIFTAAVSSLGAILSNEKFSEIYRSNRLQFLVKKEILDTLMRVIGSKNAGAIAVACGIIRNDIFGFKDMILIKSPFRSARLDLDLPAEIETKYEIDRTLAYLESKPYKSKSPVFNHPIQWDELISLPDTARAFIVTDRGVIELELFISHAPGSVANFVSLARSQFYQNKFFHRVVPNFVIQAGCPRGDGYGSLDYTIRSELGPEYYDDEGYLGMASAGKDTEGTQWFITHRPTPHLDGRYTIFGRVVAGMNVVHEIKAGDRILDVRISKA